MSKFKVGDKVRAIDDGPENWAGRTHAINGAVYTVAHVTESTGSIKLAELLTGSPGHCRLEWRYELVAPTNSYTVHDETFGGIYESFFTINEVTEYIMQHGIAGHTYTVQEHIERRRFEVVEKVQRELKAI